MTTRTEALIADLKDERAAIVLKSAPLRKSREKLRAKLQPLEDEERALIQQIKAIEGNKLFELDQEIAALTKTLKTTRVIS